LLVASGKGERMNSRKTVLLQIYLYLICLAAVIAFLFVVGNGLWGIVQISLPRLTIDEHDYKIISSFEYYKTARPLIERGSPDAQNEAVGEEELRQRYEEQRRLILDAERRGGLREFVRMWVWLITVVPIYLFHWRTARRLKEDRPIADPAVPIRS